MSWRGDRSTKPSPIIPPARSGESFLETLGRYTGRHAFEPLDPSHPDVAKRAGQLQGILRQTVAEVKPGIIVNTLRTNAHNLTVNAVNGDQSARNAAASYLADWENNITTTVLSQARPTHLREIVARAVRDEAGQGEATPTNIFIRHGAVLAQATTHEGEHVTDPVGTALNASHDLAQLSSNERIRRILGGATDFLIMGREVYEAMLAVELLDSGNSELVTAVTEILNSVAHLQVNKEQHAAHIGHGLLDATEQAVTGFMRWGRQVFEQRANPVREPIPSSQVEPLQVPPQLPPGRRGS